MRYPRTHLAYKEQARTQVSVIYKEKPTPEIIQARKDFHAFRWYVKKHKSYTHHRQWLNYLDTGEDSRCLNGIGGEDLLLLAPRGSSKSTFLIEWIAFQIGRHASPEIKQALKVLYVSYELKTARQKSQQIKRLISLPEYKRVFPWIRPGENWANELWEIDFAHADLPVADEPYTVAAAGLIGNVTGKRCLTGDTLIQTKEALIPIKDFHSKIGTDVLCFKLTNYEFEWKKITGYLAKKSNNLIEFKTRRGYELKCTIDHKIFILNRGYLEAKHIIKGDIVIVSHQDYYFIYDEIIELEFLYDCDEIVYDIEVEDNHNFFANGILTHNCHIAVYDDLIKSPESIANPDIREQMSSNYKNAIKPTRFEGARAVCLGTRMREDDIYETDFTPDQGWQVIEQSAILTRPDGTEYSYWEPEDETSPGQSLKFLQAIRDNPEEFETFCLQYQNKIIKGVRKNETFDSDWIVDDLIPSEMLVLVLGVDLSAGKRQVHDFTSFSLGGLAFKDKNTRIPHFYTIDNHEERIMGNVAKLKSIHELYKCWKHLCPQMWIYVESNGYQLSFAGDYQDYVAQNDLYDWHIVPVPSVDDKVARLRAVSGILENRHHTFNKYGRLMGKLKYQLTNLGVTKHDDMADSWTKMMAGLRARHPLTFGSY